MTQRIARFSARLQELPPGAIRPQGWLADQLRLQAEGQTGQLEEIWADVGPTSGWLGGDGESWENGPYYLDGLIALAHALNDDQLIAKAQKWVDWILSSQRADGQFGPTANDDWWPRMVALKALIQHADATGDARVEAFLSRYFTFQLQELPRRPLTSWARPRGAENVLSVLWLYERAPEDWHLELARLLLSQTDDWATALTTELPTGPAQSYSHVTHGPNTAMGLKTAAVAALVGEESDPDAVTSQMLETLHRLHGQAHGMFSGDEWLAGRAPHHGVETCQVVEYMFTLENLARILGGGTYGDALENVAYNLLPASNDPRMLAHQFVQQANQVLVSFASRDWTYSKADANTFGHRPVGSCCTANLHQGWPKLVRSMWMTDPDGTSLSAVAYGPCAVRTELNGSAVELDVRTSYPFEDSIDITTRLEGPTEFGLRLRIPEWADAATITVNGDAHPVDPDAQGYVTLDRSWMDGDQITLVLPMRLRTVPRDNAAVALRYGPLVMVHGIGEVWRPVPDHQGLAEWEITPRKSWNHGIWIEDPEGIESWPITRAPVSSVPFDADAAPISILGKGSLIRTWDYHLSSAGPLPHSPVATSMPLDNVRLLPYGSARLRVAEMPTIRRA